jgi:hypothetical protein
MDKKTRPFLAGLSAIGIWKPFAETRMGALRAGEDSVALSPNDRETCPSRRVNIGMPAKSAQALRRTLVGSMRIASGHLRALRAANGSVGRPVCTMILTKDRAAALFSAAQSCVAAAFDAQIQN